MTGMLRYAGTCSDEQIAFTDIDERANRIAIGVSTVQSIAYLRERARIIGVPSEAVVFEVAQPARWRYSLQTRSRPTVSGLQISPTSSNLGACTLGANARYRDGSGTFDGERYFITAAHCTTNIGVNDGIQVGQPTIAHTIGIEVIDPPYFTNASNSACPVNFNCRYSDAALFQYDDSVTYKFAQRPTTLNNNDTIPYMATSQIKYQDGQLYPWNGAIYNGLSVYKIGRSTGTTLGDILRTCIDQTVFNPFATNIKMLCQMVADFHDDDGDSGAPVYYNSPSQGITLMGIHWGLQPLDNVFSNPLKRVYAPIFYVNWELSQAKGGGQLDMAYYDCPWNDYPALCTP
jgi:hypothetical protein